MFIYPNDQSKNFLDTFGYLKLSLSKDFPYEEFKKDVNRLAGHQFLTSWEQIIKEKRSCAVQPFADNSAVACDFLVNCLDPYVQNLLGTNYFYLGSDASIFFAAGSAWHRDMAMRIPVLKLLIYLDFDYNDTCCDFMAMPGSHHVDSVYSSLLQKGLAWPDKHGFAGGITENGFFPGPSDPTDPCYAKSLDAIPSASISVKKFNAIIFNQALIHAVKSSIPIGKARRLVTYVFCANPKDLGPKHFSRATDPSSSNDELFIDDVHAIYAMQHQRLGIDNYGAELLKYPDYIRSHGIDWAKIISISKSMGDFLSREDGTHSTVQAKKMKEFLLKNIPVYHSELL